MSLHVGSAKVQRLPAGLPHYHSGKLALIRPTIAMRQMNFSGWDSPGPQKQPVKQGPTLDIVN